MEYRDRLIQYFSGSANPPPINCYVDGVSEMFALNDNYVRPVTGYNRRLDVFITDGKDQWNFAVPVNNKDIELMSINQTTDNNGNKSSVIIKHFAYQHLPIHLIDISKQCHDLAVAMDQALPSGPEKSAGLRKLLEAKDCFVRSNLDN